MKERKTVNKILRLRYKKKRFFAPGFNWQRKRIHFVSPRRKKLMVIPGQPLTSSAIPSRFGTNTVLCMVASEGSCIIRPFKTLQYS